MPVTPELRRAMNARQPRVDAYRRLKDSTAGVHLGALRTLIIDAINAMLPHYQAAHPNDPRPETLLWGARRLAADTIEEEERAALHRVALCLERAQNPEDYLPTTPARYVAAMLCSLLGRNVLSALHNLTMAPTVFGGDKVAHIDALAERVRALPRAPRA